MFIEDLEDAENVLRELEEEARAAYRPQIVDYSFVDQAKFIDDPHFRKAAQCTRRAGKSNGIGRCLLKESYDYPGASNLYIALTRSSAKNILWKDVLKTINRDLNLGMKFNETELVAKLRNDSQIMLAGADNSHTEMEKYLGGKYRCAVVDEAGSFRQDIRKLVYENLEPAVSDYNGWVGLIGTPTEIIQGLFFDVCNGNEKGWNLHKWDTINNPYMREKWLKRIALLIETNPRIIETPAFRRMYRNEWVIDEESKVYKYKRDFNDCESIPDEADTHVLGIDLGFNDASAFVVSAFGDYDRNLYFKEAYKKSGMIISDVAQRIKYYVDKYNPIACVIDNASKQAVEELKQRYDLDLKAADKTGKSDFIEMMNSDYQQGYIKHLMPECNGLSVEHGALIWDDKAKPKWIEHPSCENHLSDAALYNWRYCYPYLAKTKPHKKTEQEQIEDWFDERANQSDEEKPFWER